jgi:Sulfotransferase domain
MTDRQPDFVIIGATASATTWLQRNLQQHTTVFMPGPETHYFSRFFERGPAWYGTFFEPAKAHQILGEKSNSYLDHPEAPQRLRAALPNARLIVQLRNPIDRAYAGYCRHYRAGRAGEDVEHYLGADSPEAEQLRAGGLYFRSLSKFLELFPREQLCVTLYDDLDREPATVLHRIRRHVGLAASDTDCERQAMELRVEDSNLPVVPLPARRVLAPLKSLVRPFRHTPWFRATRGLIARPVRYPELTDAVRERLRAYYQDDVGALAQLLGRDLSPWMTPNRAAA